ncbi:TrkH family potassium uptake protein [Paenibacillus sacheonensis]|uniref:Trk family potassium uptake protein n=1 Tax=Paenibacillus sacheonensis TaxID=742054 RepID=A0A7X5BWF0_9BACL|nr:TrkH family potassium uptake protein [Paenibacillus sacheonensis]MBM7564830.1 trk system potassium uptake protein TrkH [Paenibacillus sacheonensis]NBC69378.1 Trk family potassium uptake protein [Paenibacillus sacheonensis]
MQVFTSVSKWSPPRVLVTGFGLIILCGSMLLALPFASSDGSFTPYIDALFTATTSTCVTGLVTVDTGSHWSIAGQIIILVLIQLGGLGFMTMATLFAILLRKRISLKERLILQEALNQSSMEGIVRLIRKIMAYALTIELAGAVLFAVRWSFDMPIGQAVYFGVFHSISFFNNAGIDLFGQFGTPYVSLTGYANDPVVNIVTMLLIVTGGIGFIVISDLLEYRRTKRLSLHSKVVLAATLALILAGTLIIFIFELSNAKTLGSLHWGGKILASFFQSVTPRTAGANTLDLASLRQATQFFIVLLMFIGASPGSTGGGIKTTTFAVLAVAVLAMIRGKEDIVLFRYRIAQERVIKALTITMISLGLVIAVTMILTTTEDQAFLKILFETTSAFATVGLTLGITPELSAFGKALIIFMMFAGRLGPLTLAYGIGPRKEKVLFRHPEGKITIG